MLKLIAVVLVFSSTMLHGSCQDSLRYVPLERCHNTSSAIDQQGGGVLCARANCTVQSLSLPLYSSVSSSSTDFHWRITGMPNFRIIVQFIVYGVKSCCNFFEITENGSQSSESLTGRLQIDPLFSRDPLILTYVSLTDVVLVKVPSNLSKNFDSVRATYQVTEEFPFNYTSPSTRESWIPPRHNCGYNLTANWTIQNIATPGWPSPSSAINNRHCVWTITADPDSRIELRFRSFKTEGCCDFVEISETGNKSVRLSGNFRRGYHYISTHSVVTIRFISDANTKSKGFYLQYKLTTLIPQRTFHQSQELVPCQLFALATHTPQPLTSPGWPQPYFENLECKWILNGRPGFRIMIQVLTVDIGDQVLQFREEGSILNEVKGRNVQTYITSSRNVLLRFRTKRSRKGIGFYATYQLTSLFPENATELTAAMRMNRTDHIIRFQENCETITDPENFSEAPTIERGFPTTNIDLDSFASKISSTSETATDFGITAPATASSSSIAKSEITTERRTLHPTTDNRRQVVETNENLIETTGSSTQGSTTSKPFTIEETNTLLFTTEAQEPLVAATQVKQVANLVNMTTIPEIEETRNLTATESTKATLVILSATITTPEKNTETPTTLATTPETSTTPAATSATKSELLLSTLAQSTATSITPTSMTETPTTPTERTEISTTTANTKATLTISAETTATSTTADATTEASNTPAAKTETSTTPTERTEISTTAAKTKATLTISAETTATSTTADATTEASNTPAAKTETSTTHEETTSTITTAEFATATLATEASTTTTPSTTEKSSASPDITALTTALSNNTPAIVEALKAAPTTAGSTNETAATEAALPTEPISTKRPTVTETRSNYHYFLVAVTDKDEAIIDQNIRERLEFENTQAPAIPTELSTLLRTKVFSENALTATSGITTSSNRVEPSMISSMQRQRILDTTTQSVESSSTAIYSHNNNAANATESNMGETTAHMDTVTMQSNKKLLSNTTAASTPLMTTHEISNSTQTSLPDQLQQITTETTSMPSTIAQETSSRSLEATTIVNLNKNESGTTATHAFTPSQITTEMPHIFETDDPIEQVSRFKAFPETTSFASTKISVVETTETTANENEEMLQTTTDSTPKTTTNVVAGAAATRSIASMTDHPTQTIPCGVSNTTNHMLTETSSAHPSTESINDRSSETSTNEFLETSEDVSTETFTGRPIAITTDKMVASTTNVPFSEQDTSSKFKLTTVGISTTSHTTTINDENNKPSSTATVSIANEVTSNEQAQTTSVSLANLSQSQTSTEPTLQNIEQTSKPTEVTIGKPTDESRQLATDSTAKTTTNVVAEAAATRSIASVTDHPTQTIPFGVSNTTNHMLTETSSAHPSTESINDRSSETSTNEFLETSEDVSTETFTERPIAITTDKMVGSTTNVPFSEQDTSSKFKLTTVGISTTSHTTTINDENNKPSSTATVSIANEVTSNEQAQTTSVSLANLSQSQRSTEPTLQNIEQTSKPTEVTIGKPTDESRQLATDSTPKTTTIAEAAATRSIASVTDHPTQTIPFGVSNTTNHMLTETSSAQPTTESINDRSSETSTNEFLETSEDVSSETFTGRPIAITTDKMVGSTTNVPFSVQETSSEFKLTTVGISTTSHTTTTNDDNNKPSSTATVSIASEVISNEQAQTTSVLLANLSQSQRSTEPTLQNIEQTSKPTEVTIGKPTDESRQLAPDSTAKTTTNVVAEATATRSIASVTDHPTQTIPFGVSNTTNHMLTETSSAHSTTESINDRSSETSTNAFLETSEDVSSETFTERPIAITTDKMVASTTNVPFSEQDTSSEFKLTTVGISTTSHTTTINDENNTPSSTATVSIANEVTSNEQAQTTSVLLENLSQSQRSTEPTLQNIEQTSKPTEVAIGKPTDESTQLATDSTPKTTTNVVAEAAATRSIASVTDHPTQTIPFGVSNTTNHMLTETTSAQPTTESIKDRSSETSTNEFLETSEDVSTETFTERPIAITTDKMVGSTTNVHFGVQETSSEFKLTTVGISTTSHTTTANADNNKPSSTATVSIASEVTSNEQAQTTSVLLANLSQSQRSTEPTLQNIEQTSKPTEVTIGKPTDESRQLATDSTPKTTTNVVAEAAATRSFASVTDHPTQTIPFGVSNTTNHMLTETSSAHPSTESINDRSSETSTNEFLETSEDVSTETFTERPIAITTDQMVASTTNALFSLQETSNEFKLTTVGISTTSHTTTITDENNKPSSTATVSIANEVTSNEQAQTTSVLLANLSQSQTSTEPTLQNIEQTSKPTEVTIGKPTDESRQLATEISEVSTFYETTATLRTTNGRAMAVATEARLTSQESRERVNLNPTERTVLEEKTTAVTDYEIAHSEIVTTVAALRPTERATDGFVQNTLKTDSFSAQAFTIATTIMSTERTPNNVATSAVWETSSITESTSTSQAIPTSYSFTSANGKTQSTESTVENVANITPAEIAGFSNDSKIDDATENYNISTDFCFPQSFLDDGERVSFETTSLHELALSVKRCNGSGRPYGVIRCSQSGSAGSSRTQDNAEYDENSLYAVPCNVTLNHLVAVASGSVNSTLKLLPALMVLTSFPETLEADNVSTALNALFMFYPKAAAKKIAYQELVSVTYTIGKLAQRAQKLDETNERITGIMSDLLSTLHQYIGLLALNSNRVSILTNAVDVQISQAAPNNRSKDLHKPRYNPVKFNFIDRRTMKGTSLVLPPSSIQSVARQLNISMPAFFVSILSEHIRLDPSQNTSRIISIGIANSNRSDIKFGINFEDLVVTDSISASKNELQRKLNKQKLVEWNYAEGDWDSAGQCEILQKSNQSTRFECPKFASYAILFSSTTIPSIVVLTRVSYVGCLLSVVFLIATILINLIPKKLRKKPTTPTLINICICLALVYIFFVFGIGLTANKTVCDTMTFLLHYFTLASLSWMTVNAYQMYRTFTKFFFDVKAHKVVVYLLAYGIPYLFVFINFSITIWYLDLPYDPADVFFESKYRARFMCWLQPPSLYYGFLLPFGILLLFNYSVFAVLLKKVIFRKKKIRPSTRKRSSKEKQRRNQLLNTFTMVTMMGLTWIFGYFLLIADDIAYQSVMQWLFIVFNVFQGVLIFYMNCLRLASVRAVWLPCSKAADQGSNGTTTGRSKPSPTIGQPSGSR